MNTLVLSLLVVAIIIIKILWIYTEIKYFKHRINFTMVKTNFVEAVILFLQILVVYLFPLPAAPFDSIIIILGVLMFVSGIILALWGRNVMKHSWGIPGIHSAKQDFLVTDGPFQFSRNPIYLGFLLIYFGFAIAIKSWLIILRIPLAIYFYKSAVREEALLEKKFGKKYLEYKVRVPRFLFI